MDADTIKILGRILVAVERIAEKLAPEEASRERLPATLTSAVYSREERERKELRQRLKGETP